MIPEFIFNPKTKQERIFSQVWCAVLLIGTVLGAGFLIYALLTH